MAFYNSINDINNFVISFKENTQQDFGVFAKGYARAASELAEHLLEKPHFSDYEAYTVVFLYRQAFELYLKGLYYRAGLISFFKSEESIYSKGIYQHFLVPLAKAFLKMCQVLFPTENTLLQFAYKVCDYAKDFEQIDSGSYSYRYPIDKKGKPSTKPHQIVNLQAFHNSMKELLTELEAVDFGFDIEASQAQSIYEIFEETQAMMLSEKTE